MKITRSKKFVGVTLVAGMLVLAFAGSLKASVLDLGATGQAVTSEVFAGIGNRPQIGGVMLAPNAAMDLSPGLIGGSVIAAGMTMTSDPQNIISPVSRVTPGSIFFGLTGLVVAVGARKALAARLRAAQEKTLN